MAQRSKAAVRRQMKKAREARAAKRAARLAAEANGGHSVREFEVLFRERGSEVHLEPITPLKFAQAEHAADFAAILKQRFPQYEYFVTT